MIKRDNNLGLIIILSFFFTSCSFNKVFLQPDKVPATTNKFTFVTPEDTVIIYFAAGNHQPTFTNKNGRDSINFPFTIESVNYKSTNGNMLNGWFLKPKNEAAKITLLHLHGNAGFLLSQYQAIAPLIKNGFQIFIFDYSGFGFSEGVATRTNVLNDALTALDYIKTRKDVQNTKVVIYGQSLGGHLSAVVAEKRQNDIDGLVIEGAFSSHKGIAGYRVPVIGHIFVKQGYRATKSIKKYHKPLLVIHSTDDPVIPFYMGKKIVDAANNPKEFYEIRNCHICGPRYYTNEISDKIKSMLNK